MKKYLSYILLVLIFFATSCSNDDIDTTPPQQTSEITAEPLNSAVLLTWVNPSDEDFALTKITYGETSIEVIAGESEKTIENLTNGTEYTFELSTVDNEGNISEPVSIKATPNKYVTVIQGNDIEDGTFIRDLGPYSVTTVFSNTNCTQRTEAGGTEFIWEGTWSFENDTTYKFDCEYYTDDFRGITHVANIIKRKSPGFCYSYSDTTFFVEMAYRKVDGSKSFLQGSYRYYKRDNSTDVSSYSDTTIYYVEISEDGTINYSDSDGNSSSSIWDNQDLLNGEYLFATYKNETYLIIREESILYNKQ